MTKFYIFRNSKSDDKIEMSLLVVWSYGPVDLRLVIQYFSTRIVAFLVSLSTFKG